MPGVKITTSEAEPQSTRKQKRKQRLYISGMMTGLERERYMEIFAATAEAFSEDYDVVNPAGFLYSRWSWLGKLLGYNAMLCIDLWVLMRCDALYSIPNWERSVGARIERAVAEIKGLKVM